MERLACVAVFIVFVSMLCMFCMFCMNFSFLLRLQTGMRGAFGKPFGLVARVKIRQILVSVRTREDKIEHAVAALRRCKYKFPGRQKVVVSDKWGFTRFTKDDYKSYQDEGRLVSDGVGARWVSTSGPLHNAFPGVKGITLPSVEN